MTLFHYIQNHKRYLLLSLLLVGGLYGRIVAEMVQQWYRDDNYSHGFLIPFIAAYFIYRRIDDIKNRTVSSSAVGLLIITLALCQLIVASCATEYFLMRASLIVLLAGMVLYLFGAGVFKPLRVSLIYLFFMIPLPYVVYNSFAFPLKLFVSKVAVAVLQAIGIAVVREGNILMFATTTLEVADACSGIRSLISLLAVSAAYAFLTETTTLKRVTIIAAAVPIAIASNALRVIVTGILAQYRGAAAAEGFFHECAGLAVFAVGILLLLATGSLLHTKDA